MAKPLISDELWEIIEPLLPVKKRRFRHPGRKPIDNRKAISAIPAVRGKPGRPRRRPKRVQGDRAYDSKRHRVMLQERGIEPVTARRNTKHGSGLGATRWVVERTVSWLHQMRRLRLRAERRADIHEAFMALGCIVVTSYFL